MSARDILIETLRGVINGSSWFVADGADAILADKRIAVVELPDGTVPPMEWDNDEPPLAYFDEAHPDVGPVHVWNVDEVQFELDGYTQEPLSVQQARKFAAALLAAAHAAEAAK